ncbi:MAG TPA: response regulator [Lysobacter sp.]
MKILIVEDDEFKLENVSSAVGQCVPAAAMLYARSIVSSLKAIEEHRDIGLVILDMSLPTYDVGPKESGGRPQGFGGLTVMQHLDALDRKVPVIVVTQFLSFEEGDEILELEDVRKMLSVEHGAQFAGLIQYSGGSESWRDELARILCKVVSK